MNLISGSILLVVGLSFVVFVNGTCLPPLHPSGCGPNKFCDLERAWLAKFPLLYKLLENLAAKKCKLWCTKRDCLTGYGPYPPFIKPVVPFLEKPCLPPPRPFLSGPNVYPWVPPPPPCAGPRLFY